MNEEMTQQLATTAEKLASAAEALDRVLAKIEAQQEVLNAKVDRIVAAVEDREVEGREEGDKVQQKVVELEKANQDLRAQAARLARKTLPPIITSLLSKTEAGEGVEPAALEKALQPLSVEQRIAVKAEMARAGMIE
jgi:predicted RNase H-like nuclease (RuvC/YqgF family)